MEIKHSARKRKKPADWRRSVMARKAAVLGDHLVQQIVQLFLELFPLACVQHDIEQHARVVKRS